MRFCLLQNLHHMTKSHNKYYIDWSDHFEATTNYAYGVSLGSEYCSLSPTRLSRHRQDKQITNINFYSMIHIENEGI